MINNNLNTDFEPGIDNIIFNENNIIPIPKTKETPLTDKEIIELRIINKQYTPPEIETLKKISTKSQLFNNHKFEHLYKLLYSENLIAIAAGNMTNKMGATTKGINYDTSDALTLKKLDKIRYNLINNNYKFKPIKRIYIDKTSSKKNVDKQTQKLFKLNKLTKDSLKSLKARPLGILTFSDKIVSEGIRIILNAIYEPEFQIYQTNYGFRPKLGVQEAIYHHVSKAKAHNYMLEADISGAFDNVNHEKLLNILRYKIKDEKFINLIKKALESGICYCGQFTSTKIGTTQGSPLSPILYNIYYHEFDKYIHTEFNNHIQKINKEENRIPDARSPLYVKITKQKAKIKRQATLQQLIDNFKTYGKDSPEFISSRNNWIISRKQYIHLDKIQKKLQCVNPKRKTIRYIYTRYADDWILSSNCTISRMEEFKDIFTNWLKNNLDLELNKQKTLITNLSLQKTTITQNKAKFLGFTLTYYSSKNKHIKKYGIKKNIRTDLVIRTKTRSIPYSTKLLLPNTKVISHVTLIVSIDKDRIVNRLIEARIIKKRKNQYYGTRKAEWSVLNPHEIIEKYNQIIRGYINYYCINLTYPSELNFLHYLLKYSCMHTLANKYNTTLNKIKSKFTTDINIKSNIEVTRKGITTSTEKTSKLLTWKNCQDIMRNAIRNYRKNKISLTTDNIDQICTPKTNWRTRYKLTKYCCICGSSSNIEYHHVRHIKIGKVTGFLQVMKQLNRKQIPTCTLCHNNIYKGTYNSLNLSDLFDERLVLL
jgi:retron-type reverse transcriptase